MRSQYSYLNATPYLYSSKELRHMYNESRSRKETEAILAHMKNHEVFDNKEYKGYFSLSQIVEEDLYGEEEDILDWQDLMERYEIVATKSGVTFREKMRRTTNDTCRRSNRYLDSNRFVCNCNEGREKWGEVFHIGFQV